MRTSGAVDTRIARSISALMCCRYSPSSITETRRGRPVSARVSFCKPQSAPLRLANALVSGEIGNGMVSVYRTTGTTITTSTTSDTCTTSTTSANSTTSTIGRRSPNAAGVFDNSVMVALYGFNWHI